MAGEATSHSLQDVLLRTRANQCHSAPAKPSEQVQNCLVGPSQGQLVVPGPIFGRLKAMATARRVSIDATRESKSQSLRRHCHQQILVLHTNITSTRLTFICKLLLKAPSHTLFSPNTGCGFVVSVVVVVVVRSSTKGTSVLRCHRPCAGRPNRFIRRTHTQHDTTIIGWPLVLLSTRVQFTTRLLVSR